MIKTVIRHIRCLRGKYRFIKNIFSFKEEFLSYWKEIDNAGILETVREAKRIFERTVEGKTVRGNSFCFGGIDGESAHYLYCLIRKLTPSVLIETGVCNGVSTAVILFALHKNNEGRLYSIDFPEFAGEFYKESVCWSGKGGAVVPSQQGPGWIIPEYLKNRWELIFGKSQSVLPHLLDRVKEIDFFMHDSEHSYDCMRYEFDCAFAALKEGGVIVADDVDANSAFDDFCRDNKLRPIRITKRMGIVLKKKTN